MPSPTTSDARRRVRTAAAAALIGLGLAAATTPSAAAEGAEQRWYSVNWSGSYDLAAAENPCGFATTVAETRTGFYRYLWASGGQLDGEGHLNGAIQGTMTLTPDDASLPTYSGSYVEKVNGVFIGRGEDALFRTLSYQQRVMLTGSDGSRLTVVFVNKAAVNANLEITFTRQFASCS